MVQEEGSPFPSEGDSSLKKERSVEEAEDGVGLLAPTSMAVKRRIAMDESLVACLLCARFVYFVDSSLYHFGLIKCKLMSSHAIS